MSKSFSASLLVAFAAFGAAGLARAEGADGPSYPALAPIQSVASRAQVQATAHEAVAGDAAAAAQYAGAAEGASYPALQPGFASRKSRADVSSQARTLAGRSIVVSDDERYGA